MGREPFKWRKKSVASTRRCEIMVVRFDKKKLLAGGLNLQELISSSIGPLAFNSPFANLVC